MRKIILIVINALILTVIFAYKFYNKPHRAIADEEFTVVTAAQLFDDFEKDEVTANMEYLDNVVQVTGTVSEVLTNQAADVVYLLETHNPMFGISCTMEEGTTTVLPGMSVTIKGVCTGYLSDVVINRGILISN